MDAGSLAVSVQAGTMTFDEFEKLADPPTGHYELHHGQLVFMPPRKKIHVKIQQALFDRLAPLLGGLGFITNELPFRPAPEYESWVADIGFVLQKRWDNDDNDYFLGAPDIVIEVLSRSNTMDEILDRQDICLASGCVAFWTVDPKRQTIMVTTPDRRTVTFGRDEMAPLPEPYQGAIELRAIFPASS